MKSSASGLHVLKISKQIGEALALHYDDRIARVLAKALPNLLLLLVSLVASR